MSILEFAGYASLCRQTRKLFERGENGREYLYRNERPLFSARECLCHSYRENLVAPDLHLNPERRPQIRALRNGPLHPDIARQIRHSRGVEKRSAARIPDHRMSRRLEIVVRLQLCYVGHIFQLAISISRFHCQRPVALRLRTWGIRQADQQSRNVLASERVLIEEILTGPRLSHFRHSGYLRARFRGSRDARRRISGSRWDLNLRSRFRRRWRWLLRSQKKT